MTQDETGPRPVAWLDHLGILGPDCQVVHTAWMEDLEIDPLREREALIVPCPVSNAVLAVGHRPGGRICALPEFEFTSAQMGLQARGDRSAQTGRIGLIRLYPKNSWVCFLGDCTQKHTKKLFSDRFSMMETER